MWGVLNQLRDEGGTCMGEGERKRYQRRKKDLGLERNMGGAKTKILKLMYKYSSFLIKIL